MSEHPKESGHWYHRNGTPAYSYLNKKGEEKPTTLREARKATPHLVPGTTMITAMADRPGLTNWKIDQAILAALTCPRIDDEPETAYLSRIKKDAQEQAKKAAERGTLIHAWVQQGFEEKIHTAEQINYYEYAKAVLDNECGPINWICESHLPRIDTVGNATFITMSI